MKKINWKILIITCIVCLVPIIGGIVFYQELPDKMAVHFDINNQPDGYASKGFALFGIPLLMMALQIFCCIISDVKQNEKRESPRFIIIVKWIIPILSLLVSIITLQIGLGNIVNVGNVVCLVLGILFILTGNYLPKMNYEDVKGKIHPMPKNEKTYRKMARLLGYNFVAFGILFLISVFFKPTYTIIIFGLLVISLLITFFYSYTSKG